MYNLVTVYISISNPIFLSEFFHDAIFIPNSINFSLKNNEEYYRMLKTSNFVDEVLPFELHLCNNSTKREKF